VFTEPQSGLPGAPLGVRESDDRPRRRVAYRSRANDPVPEPPPLGRRVRVDANTTGDWPVYRISPQTAAPAARIIYLHGGAYVLPPQRRHWKIAAQLATNVPAMCEMPLYPLAPRSTAEQTVPALAAYVNRVITESAGAPVFLVGDCAGGALALVVTQFLRDHTIRKPAGLVLISPWVDASLSAADQSGDETIPGLVAAAHAYAGALDLTNPRVSPGRGELRGLPPILTFSGTADVFDTAIQDFARSALAAEVSVELQIGAEMAHGYPLLPLLPEAAQARQRMIAWLRREAATTTNDASGHDRAPLS
jgi:epsilon-lactone hydrolase